VYHAKKTKMVPAYDLVESNREAELKMEILSVGSSQNENT